MRPDLDDTLAAGSPAVASDPNRTATVPGRPPRAASTGLVGRRLGHFQIERPLGAGGMGEVYLATDLALDRSVAIKVLPEDVARDPARRDRLIREARAQARISHTNVAHIYFVGEEDGRLAARLVENFDGEIDPDAADAWAAEIERRLAKIEAGQATLLPVDDAVARLHRAARAR